MSKVSLVVPNISSADLLAGVVTPTGQGVLKTKQTINLISLCYPSTAYTLNSDMRISAFYIRFANNAGVTRQVISTNPKFSGSPIMTCNFLYTFSVGIGGTTNYTVTGTANLSTGTILVDYTKTPNTLFEIVGYELAAFVNT